MLDFMPLDSQWDHRAIDSVKMFNKRKVKSRGCH
jgi:hypothetical protein